MNPSGRDLDLLLFWPEVLTSVKTSRYVIDICQEPPPRGTEEKLADEHDLFRAGRG